jgi:DNA repair protein RadD
MRGTVSEAPLLRPYQLEAVERIEQALGTAARPILVAPTGSGKTVILAELIRRAVDKFHRVLVIAHRREIVQQTREKLIAAGLQPGIIQAGLEKELRMQAPVQVASIQTLHARAFRSNVMQKPAATLVIIDEAHHSRARTYQQLIDEYPDATVVGATATPCRGDGRGLGNIFKPMIETPQVAELIVGGYLVGTKLYAPIGEQEAKRLVKGVKTQTGDYVVSQLSARLNTAQLVGDICAHWHKYGENRATLVFACDVAHSVHIADEFNRSGVRAEHIDGNTPKDERDAILTRLKPGETKIVTNFGVLTEGFDCPDIGCIILARPTKQMGLYRQMIGRGLRPAPGKTDVVVLDHTGAIWLHGRPEDHVEWTLDVDKRAENPVQAKRKRGEERKLAECSQCKVVMAAPPPCEHCGWMPAQRRGRDRDFLDGELGLVVNGKAKAPTYSEGDKVIFFRQLRSVQQTRDYRHGWAAHKFKDKFGHFPPWSYNDLPPAIPTDATMRWVRSRQIAYAKSRTRDAVAA